MAEISDRSDVRKQERIDRQCKIIDHLVSKETGASVIRKEIDDYVKRGEIEEHLRKAIRLHAFTVKRDQDRLEEQSRNPSLKGRPGKAKRFRGAMTQALDIIETLEKLLVDAAESGHYEEQKIRTYSQKLYNHLVTGSAHMGSFLAGCDIRWRTLRKRLDHGKAKKQDNRASVKSWPVSDEDLCPPFPEGGDEWDKTRNEYLKKRANDAIKPAVAQRIAKELADKYLCSEKYYTEEVLDLSSSGLGVDDVVSTEIPEKFSPTTSNDGLAYIDFLAWEWIKQRGCLIKVEVNKPWFDRDAKFVAIEEQSGSPCSRCDQASMYGTESQYNLSAEDLGWLRKIKNAMKAFLGDENEKSSPGRCENFALRRFLRDLEFDFVRARNNDVECYEDLGVVKRPSVSVHPVKGTLNGEFGRFVHDAVAATGASISGETLKDHLMSIRKS